MNQSLKIQLPYHFIDFDKTIVIRSSLLQERLDRSRYFPSNGNRKLNRLNVGCGSYLWNFLQEAETNTDLEDRLFWKNFIKTDIFSLRNIFEFEQFDYVYCSHVLEHILISNIPLAVVNLEYVAKRVIILVPKGEDLHSQIYNDHLTLWLKDGLAVNNFTILGRKSPINTVSSFFKL